MHLVIQFTKLKQRLKNISLQLISDIEKIKCLKVIQQTICT